MCGKCGAARVDGQIGLEQTPAEYVAALVDVFRQVWRVLRPDGVVFLNLGDSYWHINPSGPQGKNGQRASRTFTAAGAGGQRARAYDTGGRAIPSFLDCGSASQSRGDGHIDVMCSRNLGMCLRHVAAQAHVFCSRILARMEELRDHLPTEGYSSPQPTAQFSTAILDLAQTVLLECERLRASLESMPLESLQQLPEGSRLSGSLSACLVLLRSSVAYARVCVHRLGAAEVEPDGMTDSGELCEGLKYHILSIDECCSSVVTWFNTPYVKPYCTTLKPKDLIGIPWRVAFALQEDGWWLRSDIIWSKPNCMPESVTDRPTRSHEYIFLLTKAERYYMDMDAIREPVLSPERTREKNNGESAVDTKMRGFGSHCGTYEAGRNKRTVWTIPTAPYPGAHFATWPEKLVELMVLAGSSPQACECCGAPWRRVVERTASEPQRENYHATGHVDRHRGGAGRPGGYYPEMPVTTGWQPTCSCPNVGAARSVVLDPFFGSGTTGRVAIKHGRDCIGIELSEEYIREQAEARTNGVQTSLVSLI